MSSKRKFTFAISSPDEFLVVSMESQNVTRKSLLLCMFCSYHVFVPIFCFVVTQVRFVICVIKNYLLTYLLNKITAWRCSVHSAFSRPLEYEARNKNH